MAPRPMLVLLALAVLGHAVRLALTPAGKAAGAVEIVSRGPVRPASAAAHLDSIAALSRPLADGERINLDLAPVPEIARLPRVGVAMAKRIAADRAARGPFGSLSGLDRVPGIGPGLLRALDPHVAFEGGQAGGPTTAQGFPPAANDVCDVPYTLASGARPPACPPASLPLNRATISQLDALPGIGPARAAAIVRYREQHGPFGSVADLALVPGINPALMQRLYGRLQVP